MPDGATHYANWITASIGVPVLAVTATAAAYNNTANTPLALAVGGGVAAGYLLGRWIDPDLDQLVVTGAESRLMSDFKIFGALLTGWTTVYAYLMRFVGLGSGRKGHRSFFSHFPGVSTVIRLGFVAAPIAAIGYAVLWYAGLTSVLDTPLLLAVAIGVGLGLTYADTVHYLADVMEG